MTKIICYITYNNYYNIIVLETSTSNFKPKLNYN